MSGGGPWLDRVCSASAGFKMCIIYFFIRTLKTTIRTSAQKFPCAHILLQLQNKVGIHQLIKLLTLLKALLFADLSDLGGFPCNCQWTPRGDSAAVAVDAQSLNQIRSLKLSVPGREAVKFLIMSLCLAWDFCMQSCAKCYNFYRFGRRKS